MARRLGERGRAGAEMAGIVRRDTGHRPAAIDPLIVATTLAHALDLAARDARRCSTLGRMQSLAGLVVEVLSPSTAEFDQTETPEEYRGVESLRHMLVVDPDRPRARLHTRAAEGHWGSVPVVGIGVPMAAVFVGVGVREWPRVV